MVTQGLFARLCHFVVPLLAPLMLYSLRSPAAGPLVEIELEHSEDGLWAADPPAIVALVAP